VISKTVAEETGQSKVGIALGDSKQPRDKAAFYRKADVADTKKVLGWHPLVGAEEGISRVVGSVLYSMTIKRDSMSEE
jgi:nucleoside-diphosphate-sugar epimerase